jgi:hypothetical protein
MDKTTFFHIGPHKTGSTYVQQTLFRNREVLLSNGLTYSSELVVDNSGHHGLYEAVLAKDSKLIEKFCLSLGELNLISSENFEYLKSNELNYLLDFFQGHNIHVILFKRNYSDILFSAWQESIKHGGEQPFYEYLLENILFPESSRTINLPNVVECWLNNKLVKDLKIFNYDLLLSQNADITKAITRFVFKRDILEINYDGRLVNSSFDYKTIEIIRVFNKFAKNSGYLINDNLRNTFLDLKKKQPELINAALESSLFRFGEFNLASTWIINALEDKFYKHYECERIQNNNVKLRIVPQIEVSNTGCYSEDFMKLYKILISTMQIANN